MIESPTSSGKKIPSGSFDPSNSLLGVGARWCLNCWMRVLIVGCGYLGVAVGSELVRQGHQVFGMRRSPEAASTLAGAGIQLIIADVSQPASLAAVPNDFDWVISTLAPSGHTVEDYRAIYLDGTRHLLAWLGTRPPKKFLHTSSTSVYGQNDGSVVKETSPTTPESSTAKILVETEQLLLQAAQETQFPAIILRVAGIYGPDRCQLIQHFIDNTTRLSPDGRRVINLIHRDDLVITQIGILKSGRAGEIYNAVDDEPVSELHLYQWLAESLGKYMPPFATLAEEAARTRRITNKKVSNRRLKMEIGCVFKYPTFRQGYTAEIKRMDQAGLLDFEPESRDHLSAD